MLIAQITDTHVEMPGGDLDRNYDTAGHLERAVRHLNAFTPQPDVVLLTGDTVNLGSREEYGRLCEILSPLRPPLFVIPGNHDNREEMRRAFAHDGYFPTDGFLQYAIDDWPVRLIGLDTHIPGEHGGRLCEERLAWLAERLHEAPHKPTVVFLHHPPFAVGHTLMDGMGLDGAGRLAEELSPHRQVLHVLCGHLHRPVVTSFADKLASVCPSTAQQLALEFPPVYRLGTVMEPPAATLLLWDEASGSLIHHLSYIGQWPVHVLHDGAGWVEDAILPPGFRT